MPYTGSVTQAGDRGDIVKESGERVADDRYYGRLPVADSPGTTATASSFA